MKKRVHFRVEHVRPSRSREDFVSRVKRNTKLKAEAKAAGKTVFLKRLPGQPRKGAFVKGSNVETITPAAYEFLV